MPESMLIMARQANRLDHALKQKAYTFLEKLTTNDALPGLHIEPMTNPLDSRVRTGRVDQQFRAVLFKLTGQNKPTYVFIGIYDHDEAIDIARRTTLSMNPINGIAEIRTVEPAEADVVVDTPAVTPAPAVPPAVEEPTVAAPEAQRSPIIGVEASVLITELGMSETTAHRAVELSDVDQLLDFAACLSDWQGMALVDLAAGLSVEQIRASLDMVAPDEADITSDAALLASLDKPASRAQFAPIDGVDELRRVIESGDFGAWRVFLHPEQRRWATGSRNGPFRLAGGAGTGKTVVVLHRARHLARENPAARIVVTTFTVNLAHTLQDDLKRLDPSLTLATGLGEPGVYVAGIDSIASSALKRAGADIAESAARVLGNPMLDLSGRDDRAARWKSAAESVGSELRPELGSPAFLSAEYQLVVLANGLSSEEDYLRVRRPGRGVRLSRPDRKAIWRAVEAYRAVGRSEAKLSYAEAAAVAAAHLSRSEYNAVADHVLVDEGQDLSPAHWLLVRSLVASGPNDVFIAEDAHQRIYGHRLVLSRYGFETRGRSRRLTLNYRTTAENLAWAVRVLEGGQYTDLDDEAESTSGYRSARHGLQPVLKPCKTLREEFDVAAATVAGWLTEDGVAPETIGLLVRDRTQRDRLVAALHERDVTVRAVDRDTVRAGQPVAMTMHRAKGMEFAKVLLFEVSSTSIPMGLRDYDYDEAELAEAMLRERSLLYVAASRARDELVVTWTGERTKLIAD